MFHMLLVGDKMKKDNIIRYCGIRCVVLKSYFLEKDGPLLRLVDPKDKQKAYALGFECVGYPDEIVKYITEEEYKKLTQQ